jgi:hypothetical protein
MNEQKNDQAVEKAAAPPAGIAVILNMRPDRIGGGFGEGAEGESAEPAVGLQKTYRTAGWYFASDFLDRVAEVSDPGCSGLLVRPYRIEVTYLLTEKAYRNVGQVIERVDHEFRAL